MKRLGLGRTNNENTQRCVGLSCENCEGRSGLTGQVEVVVTLEGKAGYGLKAIGCYRPIGF